MYGLKNPTRLFPILIFLVALVIHMNATVALAQSRITEITVAGNLRIEAQTVLSYMLVKPGDKLEASRIDESLKALFSTGLFADVAIRRDGTRLIVNVIENPIINQLVFEGNDRIDDETLTSEVRLRPRQVYTQTRIQNDVQTVIQLYRRSGWFAATVEPKVIQLPQNRVDLVFEIQEGPPTAIRRIGFIGNRQYSDSKLRSQITTRETRWYRFLTSDDTYDPDRLTLDRELLHRFYRKNGYADFRINSAVAELTKDRKEFFVTFSIEEGEQYSFGVIDVTSSLKDLDPSQLLSYVITEKGSIFNAEDVESSVQNINAALGELGYAFVDVNPQLNRDRENLIIELTYEIKEGPRVYIDRIDIDGNVRTLDKVIRREFRVVEGDAFNTAKLRRSQQRLRALGFFDSINMREERTSEDRTVIKVEVEEQSTGALEIGAGFSSSDAILGDLRVSEKNLLGKGQHLEASMNVSARQQFIDLSFTEPYFLGRDVSAGFDVFRRRRELQDESSFDLNSVGFKLRLGFPFSEHFRQSVTYGFDVTDIDNVDSAASRFVRDQQGRATTSSLGYTLTYDVRDDRFQPTSGWIAKLGQELAGLGGNVRYIRTVVEYGHYFPVFSDVTALLGVEQGYIVGLGEDVRIDDRFFVGGDNFRGFSVGGIGPRDTSTGDALGGNIYYVGVAELSFPLGLPKEYGILGRAFSEVGSLAAVDDEGSGIFDVGSPRSSAGIGFAWRSPFGPVQVDLAYPIVAEDVDLTEVFRFSFGTRF